MAELVSRSEVESCNACGFCQAACPVYRLTRQEGASARGHFAHLKALQGGEVPATGKIVRHFEQCLTCRACTANCPTSLMTDKIVISGRQHLLGNKRSPYPILKNPQRLKRLMVWLRLGRGAKLLGKIPGLPILLSRAVEMLPGSQGRFLSERLPGINLKLSGRETVSYFMSCGMNYLCPEAGEATMQVLQAGDFQVKVAENACCGLPAYAAGDLETAKAAAEKNLAFFSQYEGTIVTDCASCSSFLKHYPELLGERAEAFASRVQDFTEFVFSHWEARYQSKVKQSFVGRITYHEPCHLSRYQNLRHQPRSLLQDLPGVEYRELMEADWCCGGAGSYALRNPELSLKILARKMQHVAETQAAMLVTACPSCLLQLESGVKRQKLTILVRHISQLLLESLKRAKA